MPAKDKSKKSVKPAVKKPVRKTPPRATFTREEKQTPAAVVPQAEPVIRPESVIPAVTPAPAPPPVTKPVENLEQILDSDTNDSVTDVKTHVVFVFGIAAALAIIAGAIAVFAIYLGSSKAPQMLAQAKKVPTVTPAPVFDRSSVTFEVMNASGVAGAATKGAEALRQAGYTVLAVGNGKKQVTSELLLSKSLSAGAVSEILADVNSLFSVSSSSGDLTNSTASARIILGTH